MAMDDTAIARGYLDGDREAVGIVDGWIRRAAWPYQRRLSSRWEDVLQDVRLEVTRLLTEGRFRGESSLKTYLWRVVNHTCLDEIRSQVKWRWEDLEVVEERPAPGGFGVESRALRDLLVRVLDRIPKDCRELWKLIVIGLSYKEIGEQLGVAEGTLRVRALRCRERATVIRRELLPVTADVTFRASDRP